MTALRCGMFGKLPSKRDFVSYGMDRQFLDLWENWLQSGVALSREQLGDAWQDAFLNAPIWRFWLGSGIAGTTTAGVFMPSVDRVGRYFPLSICAAAPEGLRIEPPPSASLDHWQQSGERLLLGMLEDELADDPMNQIAALAFPETRGGSIRPPIVIAQSVYAALDGDASGLFEPVAAADHETLHSSRSYWWTMGGRNHPPQLCVRPGLPHPKIYASFLNGDFSEARPA